MYQSKCLKYYYDSNVYSSEQVQENINEIKKQFPNKKIKVTLGLNEFGAYVINFQFENKNNYWNKIKLKIKDRLEKMPENKKYDEQKIYGQYKNTGIYKPY